MKLLDLLKSRWNNYFYSSYDIKNFPYFRFILFFYIFLFVGYDEITLNEELKNIWVPISYFNFFSYSLWTVLAKYCFYIIKISSVLSALGIFYKASSRICFLGLLINIGYYSNFGKVFHGFQLLILTVGLLSLVSVKRSSYNGWPIQLIKINCALVYFYAGLNKLFDSGFEWVFSENFYRIIAQTPGKTFFAKYLLSLDPIYSVVTSFFVLFLVQIPSIVSPFSKWFAIYFFVTVLLFHLGTSLVLGGHTDFFSQVICLLSFVTIGDKMDYQLKATWSRLKNTLTAS